MGRPLRSRAELTAVLALALHHVAPDESEFAYRLVGTAAALAQGVALPAGDIDVLVAERADVDRFAAALAGFPRLEPPAWLPDGKRYLTRVEVAGVTVEASTVEGPADSDVVECVGRGPWEHHVTVAVGRHVVPAVRLELRLGSELVRDRPDRYGPLVEHLRTHGADRALLHRVLNRPGIDPVSRARVLDRLE